MQLAVPFSLGGYEGVCIHGGPRGAWPPSALCCRPQPALCLDDPGGCCPPSAGDFSLLHKGCSHSCLIVLHHTNHIFCVSASHTAHYRAGLAHSSCSSMYMALIPTLVPVLIVMYKGVALISTMSYLFLDLFSTACEQVLLQFSRGSPLITTFPSRFCILSG